MTIFQAAFDDSGSSPNQDIFVLAGFIATAEDWANFSDAWDACLKKEPSIGYLKMSEAAACEGQFIGWRREHRDQKIFELAELIVRFVGVGMATSLRWNDYNDFLSETAFFKEINNPYWVLFFNIVITTSKVQQMMVVDPDSTMDYIFDQHGKIGDNTIGFWERMRTWVTPERKLLFPSPPVFRNEKTFRPLQASDMYAWITRNAMKDNPHYITEIVYKVFKQRPYATAHLDRPKMLEYGLGLIQLEARKGGYLI